MDINITAIQHPSTESITAYATEELQKNFEKLELLTTTLLIIKQDEKSKVFHVSLEARPKGGDPIFAQGEHLHDQTAIKEAVKKLRKQIQRYKETHYRSEQRDTVNFNLN